jgi:beta-lactamase regulating signal transducer with metallopeptidase domain
VELILNWLWQGGVVAVAAAGILRVISPACTRARYCAVWSACAAVLALPLIPLVWAMASPGAAPGHPTGVVTISMSDAWWTSPAVAIAVWAIWFTVQAIRVGAAMGAVRRAKQECQPFPSRLEARLPHWTRLSATGRRARLVLSDRVGAAAVLGGMSPLIAVAPRLLDHLGEADLDRVVIHEWAHVQRRDDVAQAVQLVVRMIAGWHPAIWWLERQLHLEREVACDDIVLGVTGSAKEYATCLTSLASLPITAVHPLPVVAAASRSGLRHRIVRILTTRRTATRSWWVTAVLGALSIGVVAVGVGNLRVVRTALSMPSASDAVTVHATGVIATPDLIAIQARPDGLRAAAATPMRVRTAVRAPSSLEQGVDTPVTGLLVEPVPKAETSAPTETAQRFAIQPVAAVTLPPVITVAPLAPPSAPVTMAPTAADRSATAADAARASWSVAADAGKAVGRTSENAAGAASRFFTRFGKTVASSF